MADPREFTARVAPCWDQIYHMAYGILHHRQDAEDVAQETMLKAWRSWSDFREECDPKTWLHQIDIRSCLDVMRRSSRRHEWPSDDVQSEFLQDAEEVALDNLAAVRLRNAVLQLSPILRLPMMAHALRGKTMEQVAADMRLPVGTVKSRLWRARQILRRGLKAASGL